MEKVSNTPRKKEPVIIKTSEYYRICPQCTKEFMADHMSRKFCSDKCGDDYNNAKKRLFPETEASIIEELPETSNLVDVQIVSPTAPSGSTENNLRILNSLPIDPYEGSYFHLEELDAKGFDFTKYAGKGKLHNISSEYNCHFLQIGVYRLFLVEYSHVLIVKTNN